MSFAIFSASKTLQGLHPFRKNLCTIFFFWDPRINVISILRVFHWRLAVSRFYQFSDIDTVFTHSLTHSLGTTDPPRPRWESRESRIHVQRLMIGSPRKARETSAVERREHLCLWALASWSAKRSHCNWVVRRIGRFSPACLRPFSWGRYGVLPSASSRARMKPAWTTTSQYRLI